ncbi:50S ribosomal protein L18 [Patescibacteria group bacterium]|nr:50S ribosomal protein L18 [Patescibacteria group bacterium]
MPSLKLQLRTRRKNKIRSTVTGTDQKPRLSVFRSNKYIYAQIIDDSQGKTIAAGDDRQIKKVSSKEYQGKSAKAFEVGFKLGKDALSKKIGNIVFDRGGYKYHGRVKALAEGARQAGLKF